MAEYPDINCACSRCTWKPETNLSLVALRQSWPNRGPEDRAPIRAYSLTEMLDKVEDWVEGDVE